MNNHGIENARSRRKRLPRRIALPGLAVPAMLILLVTCGCAHLPAQETTRYADAFSEVAAVTEELLSDYSTALDAVSAQERLAAGPPASYPILFDPAAALAIEEPDPAIVGFHNALLAVSEYNALLLDRVHGANNEGLAGRAASASKLIDALGLGASPYAASELVESLLQMIASARNRHEFADAVTKGRPIIDAILQNFADATTDFYRVRVGLVGAAITEIEFKQLTILSEIEHISSGFAPPMAGSDLALRRAQAETELAALRLVVSPNAVLRPLPIGARPYDGDVQSRIEEHIRVLRGLCAERDASIEGLTNYHRQLSSYVRLLDDTRRYFDVLSKSGDGTANSDAIAAGREVDAGARHLRDDIRSNRSAALLPGAGQPTHTAINSSAN
ncbi:MAG: hypothetical protein HUU46_02315 [Candidatus Hydrogenedentes bacterium]|nr:hypothetical protein [Candidatus Hydrogenedentota bacterium]